MEARELRIGNLVFGMGLVKPICKVSRLNDTGKCRQIIAISDDGERFDSDEVDPIPITEELLLRFGFYKPEGNKHLYSHETLDVEVQVQGKRVAVCIVDYENPATTHYIMHTDKVHTFQNAIFALTASELQLKK